MSLQAVAVRFLKFIGVTVMNQIVINANKIIGKIKPMHAVNNGPVHIEGEKSNFKEFVNAGIPFARNHDASLSKYYGGDKTVDVHSIFPDFDKDPYDEASYHFEVTDKYLATIVAAGVEVFYRLGSKIEHGDKKLGTYPPKDNKKWAIICEHIIRHYNEGWANGFHYNIRYWEIWNEPDLDADDAEDKRTWQGTFDEFIPLYETAAKHLKSCFPELMIGGPAFANAWKVEEGSRFDKFVKHMAENDVPLDFLSWHIYAKRVRHFNLCAANVRNTLDKYGFFKTESILNEWNYVENWTTLFDQSIEVVSSMKGAAFIAAIMVASQNNSIDMLMYYDARPSTWNGMFNVHTMEPIWGYYPFVIFNDIYKKGNQLDVATDSDKLYAVAAKGDDGEVTAMVSYYFEDEADPEKTVEIRLEGVDAEKITVRLLDQNTMLEEIKTGSGSSIEIAMKHNTVVEIKAK